jgi:hypothetical protein
MAPRYTVRTQADARYYCVWDNEKNRVAAYTEEPHTARAYIDLAFEFALKIALRLNAQNAAPNKDE